MKQDLSSTAAGTPKIKVADCIYNADQAIALIREMEQQKAKSSAVLPELCITGYTCGICSGRTRFWIPQKKEV